jgi:hypothetical protein
MDRIVLLALLAIPILVVVHVALLGQPVRADGVRFWPASRNENRPQLQGYWQSPEQLLPTHFVVETTAEQGS